MASYKSDKRYFRLSTKTCIELIVLVYCHDTRTMFSSYKLGFMGNNLSKVIVGSLILVALLLACIIIIIILVITFMHGIYNYIPETNRVSRVYNIAAVLY
jgi:hypothetical protein